MRRSLGSASQVMHLLVALALTLPAATAHGQDAPAVPTARLVPAIGMRLPGGVDSNSPLVWDLVDGVEQLSVLTSTAGRPSLASGARLRDLRTAQPVTFTSHPGGGVWMEAVIVDEGGTWYGYYHNEIPAEICGRPDLTVPRIGAARSSDRGGTWQDLGIVLEAPRGEEACDTRNQYFAGGVGDLSVALNDAHTDLYLFFSQYSREPDVQGVAVARLPWAARDEPVGRVDVWERGIWRPARFERGDNDAGTGWTYPAGTSIFPTQFPWHDGNDFTDAFWGPSVHWNVALQRYVMLVNRASDERWGQDGTYVSFAASLDDPSAWSTPQKLLDGGLWYPQVVGLEPGGTDREAGARARFFTGGMSNYLVEFSAP